MFGRPYLPLSPLERAKKRTKEASIAAYFSATLTAMMSVGEALSQKSQAPLIILPDAVLLVGLGYGVRKNSRICAAALVGYWIAAKWMLWSDTLPGLMGIFIAVCFWLCFIGGLVGAVNYHRYKNGPNPTTEPVQTSVPTSAGQEPRRP